jgi:hypothetical protein
MKVYAIKHEGHYPVGACSVVVADDETDAKRACAVELLAREIIQPHLEAEMIADNTAGSHCRIGRQLLNP